MGITSEHLVEADEQLLSVLSILFTKILSDGAVPATMKSGLVHPVPKKGKNAKRPDSYRRITVTSIVGKILERILMDPLKETLAPTQSSQQRGFTDSSSSNMAALLVTEVLAETKDRGQPLYITYLDASKAFDVTWHASVFTKLLERGIHGNMWCTLRDWYIDLVISCHLERCCLPSFHRTSRCTARRYTLCGTVQGTHQQITCTA